MPFRFRKRLRILPGVHLNVSQKGISSVSIGKRGATVNINAKGIKTTFGLPGTGLSYQSRRKKQSPPTKEKD